MPDPSGEAALIPGAALFATTERPLQPRNPRDLGSLLLGAQGLLLAGSIAWTLVAGFAPAHRDAVFLIAGGLLAAVQCAWSASAARAEPRTRRGWTLVAVGFVAWAAADFRYYLLDEFQLGVAPLTHGLYFVYYGATVLGLLSFPSSERGAPLRLALDTATVVIGGSLVMSYLVLQPLARHAGEDGSDMSVVVPYAVADLVLLMASALLALKPLHPETRPAFRLVALGQLLSLAFGLVYAAEMFGSGRFNVYMKGYLLVQLLVSAGAYAHRRRVLEPQPAPPPPEPRHGMSVLPYAAIALGFATLVYAAARAGDAALYAPLLQAAALTAVVVARQALAVREEARLLVEREAQSAEERERRRAHAERERLLLDLETKNAELQRFTYAVSHDLKSPLITIRGFVDQLRSAVRSGDAARVEGDLERIAGAAGQMSRLLAELLELSRIGHSASPHETLPLRPIVEDALALARASLEGVQVDVALRLPDVYGDRTRLVQLLQGLLENAGQFRSRDRPPRVEIGARRDEAASVFYVRDNGIGIEPRHHERVFALFQKLDPKSPGSGIGLVLARRIVEAHGGRLWVESEGIGRGSSFCFTLGGP